MSRQLQTEIEIAAAPEVVWDVLTDLEHYRDWNPFVVEAMGEVSEGKGLRVRLRPPGGRAVTLRPTVTVAAPATVFEWLGHLLVRGVFDGRHRFELEPTATGTRLTHSETFRGVLAPVVTPLLAKRTRAGFVAMNDALKAVVEARARVRR